MKTKYHLLWLCIIGTMLACDEAKDPATLEKVQFTFNMITDNTSGRINTTLPPGTMLIVTIQKANGELAYDYHGIELLKIGDHYISQPLDLAAGSYKLLDFMLVNGSNEVLYATPKHGSPMANAVQQPLPFSFYVSKDNITNLSVEVVSTSNQAPEHFGYASFNIVIHDGLSFPLSVMVLENDQFHLASGIADFILNGDTIKTIMLKPVVNAVYYPALPEDSITLSIRKEGYATYQTTFTYNALLQEIGTQALEVILTPAVIINTPKTNYEMGLTFNSDNAEIIVDWGDGIIEEKIINNGEAGLLHAYTATGNHSITITGDLDEIVGVNLYGSVENESFDFGRLTNLTTFFIDHSFYTSHEGNTVIDLSRNEKLTELKAEASDVYGIIVSDEAPLRYIELFDCSNFSRNALDKIIQGRYKYATEKGLSNGTLYFTKDPFGLIIPFSEASQEKLKSLLFTYNWSVTATELYLYKLELFYKKQYYIDLAAGLPGNVTETDYAIIDVQVSNYSVIANLMNVWENNYSVTPFTATNNDCESEWLYDYYVHPLFWWPLYEEPVTAATGTILHTSGVKTFTLDFQNQNATEPFFTVWCALSQDGGQFGNGNVASETILPDANFEAKSEIQHYQNSDNTVTGILTPYLPE